MSHLFQLSSTYSVNFFTRCVSSSVKKPWQRAGQSTDSCLGRPSPEPALARLGWDWQGPGPSLDLGSGPSLDLGLGLSLDPGSGPRLDLGSGLSELDPPLTCRISSSTSVKTQK